MNENDKEITENMQEIAFSQLLEQIRKQDDLIHSWTKYYLSIQAGLAVALAFVLKLNGNENDILMKVGLLFFPILGIATAWCLTNIIVREHKWQGSYIKAIRKLNKTPIVYESEPDPQEHGFIARQFILLRRILVFVWTILFIIFAFDLIKFVFCFFRDGL
ncbi:hypothetical protein ES708_09387 [subsurface metagenome]